MGKAIGQLRKEYKMYNVGTKITIEAREEHTFCDGDTAIIWEVRIFEFKDLAKLEFRVTQGENEFNHDPLEYCRWESSLFEARNYIKRRDDERRESMKEEEQNNENS